jgi:hypothetical protein
LIERARRDSHVLPVVDLAPGTERNPLAQMFAELVRRNVVRPAQRREFDRLRGSAAIVVDDAGDALTLRFDFGRLTVHEGLVGVPDITILGVTKDIETLTKVPFWTHTRLPLPKLTDREGRAALLRVVRALRSRNLKIYGLLFHARFVIRLLRVLSNDGPS